MLQSGLNIRLVAAVSTRALISGVYPTIREHIPRKPDPDEGVLTFTEQKNFGSRRDVVSANGSGS